MKELTPAQKKEVAPSLKQFFREEWETELSDLRAGFLLDYLWKEIAPFAYNQGVKDAEAYFRERLEDLAGSCYEEPMTFWLKKKRKG